MSSLLSLPKYTKHIQQWAPDICATGFEAKFAKRQSGLIVTCEHASNAVTGKSLNNDDRELLDTHWGWDRGAAIVGKQIASDFECFSIFGKQSRLVCDLNRQHKDQNWIRRDIYGQQLSFNRDLDELEMHRRKKEIFMPYHRLLDVQCRSLMATATSPVLISMHSMTPVFEGSRRDMDIAILHCGFAHHANTLDEHFRSIGLRTAINEPYSAMDAVTPLHLLSIRQDIPVLWIELNQAIVQTSNEALEVGRQLSDVIATWMGELSRTKQVCYG